MTKNAKLKPIISEVTAEMLKEQRRQTKRWKDGEHTLKPVHHSAADLNSKIANTRCHGVIEAPDGRWIFACGTQLIVVPPQSVLLNPHSARMYFEEAMRYRRDTKSELRVLDGLNSELVNQELERRRSMTQTASPVSSSGRRLVHIEDAEDPLEEIRSSLETGEQDAD